MLEPLTIPVSDDLHLATIFESDRVPISNLLNDRQVADQMLRIPHPYSESDFDTFLEVAESSAANNQPQHFTLHHSEHGPIGGFGFEALRHGHRVEIGYWLGRPFWGQGIMPTVIRSACEHAFRVFGVKRITAHVFKSNAASARALEKCGFVYEGLLRECFIKNDEPIDARLFALLKSDLPLAPQTLLSSAAAAPEPLSVTQATERDLAQVTALFDGYRQFYGQSSDLPAATEFIGERLARRESTILLARRDDQAVGFTQLYPSFSSVSMRPILILNDLFVREDARQAGVAHALMAAAEDLGRQQNCRRLCLCTEVTNTIAQSLYESRGWSRDEQYYHYDLEL